MSIQLSRDAVSSTVHTTPEVSPGISRYRSCARPGRVSASTGTVDQRVSIKENRRSRPLSCAGISAFVRTSTYSDYFKLVQVHESNPSH